MTVIEAADDVVSSALVGHERRLAQRQRLLSHYEVLRTVYQCALEACPPLRLCRFLHLAPFRYPGPMGTAYFAGSESRLGVQVFVSRASKREPVRSVATLLHELGHIWAPFDSHSRRWREGCRRVVSSLGYEVSPELREARTVADVDEALEEVAARVVLDLTAAASQPTVDP